MPSTPNATMKSQYHFSTPEERAPTDFKSGAIVVSRHAWRGHGVDTDDGLSIGLIEDRLPAANGDRPTLLRIDGLSKTFPGTRALSDVSIDIRAGEVHAL